MTMLRIHCEQWLALKMRVRYGISIVLLLTSYKAFLGYVGRLKDFDRTWRALFLVRTAGKLM